MARGIARIGKGSLSHRDRGRRPCAERRRGDGARPNPRGAGLFATA